MAFSSDFVYRKGTSLIVTNNKDTSLILARSIRRRKHCVSIAVFGLASFCVLATKVWGRWDRMGSLDLCISSVPEPLKARAKEQGAGAWKGLPEFPENFRFFPVGEGVSEVGLILYW